MHVGTRGVAEAKWSGKVDRKQQHYGRRVDASCNISSVGWTTSGEL